MSEPSVRIPVLHLLALVLIATVLVGVSAWRFRSQLS
jgi:hypothetical protein